MAGLNINAGAQGNPLDALLGGSPINGSLGFDLENALAQARAGTIDPRLYALGYGQSPFGENYEFKPTDPALDPATGRIMLNGRQYIQLPNTSIGGPGEPIDPSQVTKDPRFGLLTPYSNIKPISSGYGDMVFGLAALGLGGPALGAAMGAGSGAAGSGAFEGATADAVGSGAFEGATAGATGAASAEPLAGAAGSSAAPFEGASASASGNGLFGNLASGNVSGLASDAAQWAMDNPLRAAALLQTGYGLVQNNRSQPSSSSGSKSSGGTTGSGLPMKNPAGSYQWTPNPYLLAQIGGRP